MRIIFRIRLMTDRPQHPTVERVELVQRARRQCIAERIKCFFADGNWVPVDGAIHLRRCRAHHLDGFGHNFEADVVTFEYADVEGSIHRCVAS